MRVSAKEDIQKWIDSVIVNMETALRQLYQLVKQFSGRSPAGAAAVKGEDGRPLEHREEVKPRWAGHFEELLSRPPRQRKRHRIGPTGERAH